MYQSSSENESLDTLVKKINLAFSLNGWEKMIELSKQLYTKAKALYEETLYKKEQRHELSPSTIDRPLVYYYGYSHLTKGVALQKLNRLDETLNCIESYANLDWFNGLDEEGLREVDYFRNIAVGNRISVNVLRGQESALLDLVIFLKENPEEMLPGAILFLQAANRYGFDITPYLQEFDDRIDELGGYDDSEHNAYFITFLEEYVEYASNKNKSNVAIIKLLSTLEFLSTLKDDFAFKKGCMLFKKLEHLATPSQTEKYIRIVNPIREEVGK